ncbi:unnamed protein product [Cylindrotheca closterium]|uniref:Cyclin N-terminal domain-containing protein n=1 Tax=Cylindrotheca closterium TaxID=2856 RepID=A0AAD2JH53_9STRA|nr:unnamed protein product [Cylindrotheca closterium]
MTISTKRASPVLPLSSALPSESLPATPLGEQHLKKGNLDEKSSDNTQSPKIRHFKENTLDVILQQEAKTYRSQSLQGLDAFPSNDQSCVLDWFRTMTQFCYTVVDCCELPQQSVEVAINILDRFLFGDIEARIPLILLSSDSSSQSLMSMRLEILSSSSNFQLATMTCLYIACKLFSTKCLFLVQLERLSGNTATARDIESMERQILSHLQFQINAPTIVSFAQEYVQEELQIWSFPVTEHSDCDGESHSEDQRLLFLHLVEQQSRLATCKLYTFHVPISSIALACVKNALEVMENVNPTMKLPIFQTLWSDLENKVRSYYYDDQRDIALVQEQLQSSLRIITLEAMQQWANLDQTNDVPMREDNSQHSSSKLFSLSPRTPNASSPTAVIHS